MTNQKMRRVFAGIMAAIMLPVTISGQIQSRPRKGLVNYRIYAFLADPSSSGGTGTVINAATQTGSDACAKIAAAFNAMPPTGGIVDAVGLSGKQSCSVNPLADAPPNSTLLLGNTIYSTSVTWSTPNNGTSPISIVGVNSGPYAGARASVIRANTVIAPVLDIQDDQSSVSNVEIDGGGLATTGILMRTSQSFQAGHADEETLNNVFVDNLAPSGSTGIDMGSADALHGCADCTLRNVVVHGGMNYTGTGIKIAREDNRFINCQISGWAFGTGVDFVGYADFGGPDMNNFRGGAFTNDGTNITTEATNVHEYFYSVWFESGGPIIGNVPHVSAPNIDQQFTFFGCHFNTISNASLFDLTNVVGGVWLFRGSYDISSSSLIILPATADFIDIGSSYANSLKFSGPGRHAFY